MKEHDEEEYIVFRYTRAMAIADGALIDGMRGELEELSRQHFPGTQVALTRSVFELLQRARECAPTSDFRGLWHDILWMSRQGLVQLLGNGRLFKVGIRDATALRWHTLKIIFHAGDNGESCATVMLPDEE